MVFAYKVAVPNPSTISKPKPLYRRLPWSGLNAKLQSTFRNRKEGIVDKRTHCAQVWCAAKACTPVRLESASTSGFAAQASSRHADPCSPPAAALRSVSWI
eukprot:730936-Rhodomonas_salina.1